MAHVLVLDSVNEDVFVCGVCKTVFNSLELFLDHKQMKCLQENLECILAIENDYSERLKPVYDPGENTINSAPQAESSESTESTNDLTCTGCNRKFKKNRGYQAHLKTHCAKPHQCLICGRCFFVNSHLQRHLLTHKVWPESLSENTPKCPEMELLSYSCTYCAMTFTNYFRFRSHLKNHESFKMFKCIQGDCTEFYDTIELLLDHVSSYHIMQSYTCHICNELFDSLPSIASHELSHHEIAKDNNKTKAKQYKCFQCDAVFTKPENLSLHQVTENHQKVCIHCNKTFASDKRLRLHLQTHSDVKPFQCNICDQSFHMKKYLTSHMLKHGSKKFKCPVCSCRFNRSDILRRHIKSHSDNKMFPCPYRDDTTDCKREFSRKDKLIQHLRSYHKCKPSEDSSQEDAEENSYHYQVAKSNNTEIELSISELNW